MLMESLVGCMTVFFAPLKSIVLNCHILLLDRAKKQRFQAQPLWSPGGMTCKNQMFLKNPCHRWVAFEIPTFLKRYTCGVCFLAARKPRFISSYSWSAFSFFQNVCVVYFLNKSVFQGLRLRRTFKTKP